MSSRKRTKDSSNGASRQLDKTSSNGAKYLRKLLELYPRLKNNAYICSTHIVGSHLPGYDSSMIKFSVSMTPELYSALTNAALDHHTSVSREIETFLRENATVQKYIAEVRAEPDTGVLAVNPNRLRPKEHQATVSASE